MLYLKLIPCLCSPRFSGHLTIYLPMCYRKVICKKTKSLGINHYDAQRSSLSSSLEMQTQAHLDCESVSTQVLLGEITFTELDKGGDREVTEEEQAIPATWTALHPGHSMGYKLPTIAEPSHLCFQVLLQGHMTMAAYHVLLQGEPIPALHLLLFLLRNRHFFNLKVTI